MTSSNIGFTVLMFASGLGIPVMAAMNAGLSTRIGSPVMAVFILSFLSMLVSGLALVILSPADMEGAFLAPFPYYLGGLIFLFYIFSVTVLELESGKPSSFSLFHDAVGGKPYEIEHIWADNYERHRNEFEQSAEFDEWRNRIGALILVPRGTNQSYGGMPYYEKLPHYLRENTLAASLNEGFYKNNPNFRNMAERYSFDFKSHKEFSKDDIVVRQKLLQNICERIFSFED